MKSSLTPIRHACAFTLYIIVLSLQVFIAEAQSDATPQKADDSYIIIDGKRLPLVEHYKSSSDWELKSVPISSMAYNWDIKDLEQQIRVDFGLSTDEIRGKKINEVTTFNLWENKDKTYYTGNDAVFSLRIDITTYKKQNLQGSQIWNAVDEKTTIKLQNAFQIINGKTTLGKLISFENLRLRYEDGENTLDSIATKVPTFPDKYVSGKLFVYNESKTVSVNAINSNRYFLTFISKEPAEFHPIKDKTTFNRFGHIFVQWISLENNQTKIEAYGYYGTPGKTKPGELPSRLRDELINDDYWRKGSGTFRVQISKQDYDNTILTRKRWFSSPESYNYLTRNCVNFAFNIATAAKISIGNVPSSVVATTPYGFVVQLYILNKSKYIEIDDMYSK